jgi:DNA-binding CsgD family transcriptional regulator
MTVNKLEKIHVLWDELADFSAAETEAALHHLMARLCQFVRAGNAYWIGGMRLNPKSKDDPLKGWRPCAHHYLHAAPVHEEAYKAQASKWNRREVDASYEAALKNTGSFRSYRLRQTLPAEWFTQPYYQLFYASRGFHDTCFVTFPLNEDMESYFAFHRVNTTRNFTEADEMLLAYALRGIKWFHRQLILSHGVMLVESPLTVAQRRVTSLLLTEKSEKEIATELGVSFSTTHKHVGEIFRSFGVNSRAGLMALWLGK